MEPIHVVALGLLIALGGVVWQFYSSAQPPATAVLQGPFKTLPAPLTPLPPADIPPGGAPVRIGSATTAAAERPILLHSYADDVDRKQIREHLREASRLIHDEVSPTQLAIHRIASNSSVVADAPDALMKAHERLNAVRAYLLRTFPGGRQHSDEMWDALGSTDGLFAAMEGLRTNIPEAKALQSIEDTEQRRRILEANGRLGQWVG